MWGVHHYPSSLNERGCLYMHWMLVYRHYTKHFRYVTLPRKQERISKKRGNRDFRFIYRAKAWKARCSRNMKMGRKEDEPVDWMARRKAQGHTEGMDKTRMDRLAGTRNDRQMTRMCGTLVNHMITFMYAWITGVEGLHTEAQFAKTPRRGGSKCICL
jgi:hypothetical protein